MPNHKIVVRYNNGRLVKGCTTNFNPNAPAFTLTPAEAASTAPPEAIDVCLLKAIFFVRDFAGNPGRKDRDSFEARQPYAGRRIEVVFKDGEVLIGSASTYSPTFQGFFVFPADTDSNTLKVFAVNASVRSARWLDGAQKKGG